MLSPSQESLNKFRVENKSGHYLNTGCVDDIPPSEPHVFAHDPPGELYINSVTKLEA